MGRFVVVNSSLVIPVALIVLWLAVSAISRCSGYLLRKVRHFHIATPERRLTSLRRAPARGTRQEFLKGLGRIVIPGLTIVAISLSAAPALAQSVTGGGASLGPASVFPYDVVGQSYVPSLYFPAPQREDEPLVAAPDFPYETGDLCYAPSLYYEARKIAAVQALK